jgi:hypothetical protein
MRKSAFAVVVAVKRTHLIAAQMSAFDPKRTLGRSLNDLCLNSHLIPQMLMEF